MILIEMFHNGAKYMVEANLDLKDKAKFLYNKIPMIGTRFKLSYSGQFEEIKLFELIA